MSFRRRRFSGFSLLEVIIAIGIFAVGVSAILGLLPALSRQAGRSADTLNAMHLGDALRIELQRMAAAGGFDALAAETKPLTAPLSDTCQLVAMREGLRLHALNFQPPPEAEQFEESGRYFLIEVWRFNETMLAYESGDAALALHVRVSWPFRIPGATAPVPAAERESITFNLALHR